MSTRATYHFVDNDITFYVHHDGYEEGAAHKFFDMIHTANAASYIADDNEFSDSVKATNRYAMQAGWAFAFAAANYGASVTGSHEEHADTEFCYDLFNDPNGVLYVRAFKQIGDWDHSSWRKIFEGPVCNFINTHLRDPEHHATWMESRFKHIETMTSDHWLQRAKALMTQAERYKDNSGHPNPNRKISVDEAAKICQLLQIRPDEVSELNILRWSCNSLEARA